MLTASKRLIKPKNRALTTGKPVIQPALKIGKPNDKYEKEADRVADDVMRMPPPTHPLQMQAKKEEELQMKCKECEHDKLQMIASPPGSGLIAHELTHVLQQGKSVPGIQKQEGDETSESNSDTENSISLASIIGGIVREQLSDEKLKNHLKGLGSTLRDLALQGIGDSSGSSAERLAALNIPNAFETTARAIIQDPDLRHLRQRFTRIIGNDDGAALVTVLAAGLAAFLADVDLEGEPSIELGAGFTIGGMFDLGSARDIEFNQIQAYVQFAHEIFRTRVTGGLENVDADEETGEPEHLVGTGTGEIRVGSDINHILSRISINSDGEITLTGQYSAGYQIGNNDRFVFTAGLAHQFATNESLFTTGLSGRFNLDSNQRIEIGSQLQFSSDEGLNRLTGFVEYQRDRLFLRIEGNMQGIERPESMIPGNEMRIQIRATIPFEIIPFDSF